MTIDLRLNGVKHSLIEMETAKPLREILRGTDIAPKSILTYKINHAEYVNAEYIPQADTLADCISLQHPEGARIYQDSLIFILAKAVYNILGSQHTLVVEHSIGDGVFCEVFNTQPWTEQDSLKVKEEMRKIVDSDLPIDKIRVRTPEALDILSSLGRKDLIKNIKYAYRDEVSIYRCGKFYDMYLRPLADRTGMVDTFDVVHQTPGFILRFPSGPEGRIAQPFRLPQKLFQQHQEHDKWLDILRVHDIIDINKLTDNYDISEFILVEEALHEKKIAEIAADITKSSQIKLILVAGPSSSGKTTFAKRLSIQLQACKAKPIVIGLDDYFIDRDKTVRKDDGEFDFESIYALDLDYLNLQLTQLLNGEEVELPRYDFTRGMRQGSNKLLRLKEDNVIVMEGIHGLNDTLTASIPASRKAKIYVSALNQLNIDNHNRVATTDCRLLRRIIRDQKYRGYTAPETIQRWPNVREGEEKNIFPYQENADYMFNSSLTYELGVLRKHAWKLLNAVPKSSSAYTEARRLLALLATINDIPDTLVPYNSIIREFTSGSIFQY
ncbi:MAG TPA: nucleoside kinase [Candidatus Syntrophosphaera sp.]|jgi:uridine kinase|nr:nucleoside kinase [Candidatus Syntrophosphaera sp.]